MVKRVILYRLS